MSAEVTVASWNVHWGVVHPGTRRAPHTGERFDVGAAAGELGLFDADVVVLPETFRAHDGTGTTDGFAAAGFEIVEVRFTTIDLDAPSRPQVDDPGQGWWTLAVATRLAVLEHHVGVLPRVVRDQVRVRHALRLRLALGDGPASPGRPVDVVAVHASSRLWWAGPWVHLRGVRRLIDPEPVPTVLAGDCNLWGPAVERLLPGFRRTVFGPTYPAARPHSQIDHVLADAAWDARGGAVLAPRGSDHRAVRSVLRLRR